MYHSRFELNLIRHINAIDVRMIYRVTLRGIEIDECISLLNGEELEAAMFAVASTYKSLESTLNREYW